MSKLSNILGVPDQGLCDLYKLRVHGDITCQEYSEWDLEFASMFQAIAFVEEFSTQMIFCEIRHGDNVASIHGSVVLTVRFENPTVWQEVR